VGDGVPLSDIIAPSLIEIYKARSKQVRYGRWNTHGRVLY
jgi:hypothetical protein